MVLSVDFAISNQGPVDLALWPFLGPMTVKVYIFAFGVFVISFFSGGFIAWLGAGNTRGRARSAERKVRAVAREIASLKRKLDKVESASNGTREPRALQSIDNN